MKNSTKFMASALAGVLALAAMDAAAHGVKEGMEKCAGVVKAGENDCGTATHACGGQAAEDGMADEWVAMPKGTCAKLVNGKVIE